MGKCEHKNLKKLYYRKYLPGKEFQSWIVINDFCICDDCGVIFKILEERKVKKVKG